MRNLKKVLLSLGAAAAVAALATGGTFAVFTGTDSLGGNNIDSGSVVVDIDGVAGDGTGPVLGVSDLVIGDTETGTLVVSNTGDNKASYDLTGSAVDGSVEEPIGQLAENLHITIQHGSDPAIFDGTLAAFNQHAGVDVAALSPGISRSYNVTVTLDGLAASDDNVLQNKSLVETFSVLAAQRDGVNRDTNATPES